MPKQVDPRRAKIHHSYTVAEVAALFGVHRNTVRNWIEAKLPTIRTLSGVLIHGADLREFLMQRRARRHQTCPPGHMFCFGCRKPREAVVGSVEIDRHTTNSGNAHGVCSCCGARMHRRLNLTKLVEKGFDGAPARAGRGSLSR